MSNSHDHDFDELEPLEEMDELEPLEELEPMEELAELEPVQELAPAARPAAAATPTQAAEPRAPGAIGDTAAAAAAASASDEKQKSAPGAAADATGKRELEQTPIILRKAALILFAGTVLPWLVALKADPEVAVPWGVLYAAKGVALIAAWLFHQGVMAMHDGPAVGFMKPLAGMHKVVPTVLFLLIGGVAIFLVFGKEGLDGGAAAGEVATMLLAAATFTHIWGYEHGGKFNPIFPIMFLGPALAGLLSVFGAAAKLSENAALAGIGLVGCLTVGAGGGMAIYALYQAMKQAKIEGEEKKRLMREHRKAQREAQRAQAGAGKKA